MCIKLLLVNFLKFLHEDEAALKNIESRSVVHFMLMWINFLSVRQMGKVINKFDTESMWIFAFFASAAPKKINKRCKINY